MAQDYPKSVFTYRFEDEVEDRRPPTASRWAAALAALGGAHLNALVAVPHRAVPNVFGASLVKNIVGGDNAQQGQAAQAIAEALRTQAAQAGIQADVSVASSSLADVRALVTAQARLADIVVADASADATGAQQELLSDVLFHASRPVVVVPPTVTDLSLETVVVGWDGTSPATRAVHDALPLLRQAGRVDVVSVLKDKDLAQGGRAADIVPHLLRHGVKAHAVELESRGDAAHVLLHHATSNYAGLLVIGAYAHSRLRQLVFGGFTSALLKDCPIPLLLSH